MTYIATYFDFNFLFTLSSDLALPAVLLLMVTTPFPLHLRQQAATQWDSLGLELLVLQMVLIAQERLPSTTRPIITSKLN